MTLSSEKLDQSSYKKEDDDEEALLEFYRPRLSPDPLEFMFPLEKLLNLSKKAFSKSCQSRKYPYRSSAPYCFYRILSLYSSASVSLACLSWSARIRALTPSHTSWICASSYPLSLS